MEVSEDDSNFTTTIEPEEQLPDYVCCVLTEGIWTWFAATLLSVILLLIATLKYCKKHFGKAKFSDKNNSLLHKSLIEDDGDAIGKIRLCPVRAEEFVRYCTVRRRHVTIDSLEYNRSHSTRGGTVGCKLESYIRLQEGTYLDRDWLVTKGPEDATIIDFWANVWQENVSIIVMLTKTFEVVKLMCSQYWPLHVNSKESYGNFTITLEKEDIFADYKVRYLTLRNNEKDEDRPVVQFHYLSWPLSELPYGSSLLEFRRYVRLHMDNHPDLSGPPLLHCHDGGGRSGTYLAIEANLCMVEKTNTVDILGTVTWLHSQRSELVSCPALYRFIYNVLETFIRCGDTSLTLSTLCSEDLSSKDVKEKRKREFLTLCSLRPHYTTGDCAAGHRAENRDKNRNVLVVPPDDRRPYLTSFQSNTCTDYINAVLVDGFCRQKEMVATEWPLSHTMANFWSMVYDHDCVAVVVLNRLRSKAFAKFWPTTVKEQKHFGPVFTVSLLQKSEDDVMHKLKLSKKEIAPHRKTHALVVDEKKQNNRNKSSSSSLSNMLLHGIEAPSKTIRLYHFNDWPQNANVPTSPQSLHDLMTEVNQFVAEEDALQDDGGTAATNKIAIVSCDGMSRIGVYCAAHYAFKQVTTVGRVDLFSAVESVRRSRPQLVDSLEEYNFIHKLVHHFVANNNFDM